MGQLFVDWYGLRDVDGIAIGVIRAVHGRSIVVDVERTYGSFAPQDEYPIYEGVEWDDPGDSPSDERLYSCASIREAQPGVRVIVAPSQVEGYEMVLADAAAIRRAELAFGLRKLEDEPDAALEADLDDRELMNDALAVLRSRGTITAAALSRVRWLVYREGPLADVLKILPDVPKYEDVAALRDHAGDLSSTAPALARAILGGLDRSYVEPLLVRLDDDARCTFAATLLRGLQRERVHYEALALARDVACTSPALLPALAAIDPAGARVTSTQELLLDGMLVIATAIARAHPDAVAAVQDVVEPAFEWCASPSSELLAAYRAAVGDPIVTAPSPAEFVLQPGERRRLGGGMRVSWTKTDAGFVLEVMDPQQKSTFEMTGKHPATHVFRPYTVVLEPRGDALHVRALTAEAGGST
jgi:hypothetical protein